MDELLRLHDARFVRAAYLQILGRSADEYGLKSYVELLSSGVAREQLIVALAESDEGRRNESLSPHITSFVEAHRSRKEGVVHRVLNRLGRMLNRSQEAPLRALANNVAAIRDQLDAERADWHQRHHNSRLAETSGRVSAPHAQTIAELEALAVQGASSAATLTAALRLSTALANSDRAA